MLQPAQANPQFTDLPLHHVGKGTPELWTLLCQEDHPCLDFGAVPIRLRRQVVLHRAIPPPIPIEKDPVRAPPSRNSIHHI